jgi:hypothetical protein
MVSTTVFQPGSTLSTILDPLSANAPYLTGTSLFERTLRSQYNALGISPTTVDNAFGAPNFLAAPVPTQPVSNSIATVDAFFQLASSLLSSDDTPATSDQTASEPVASASVVATTEPVNATPQQSTPEVVTTTAENENAIADGPGRSEFGHSHGNHGHGNGLSLGHSSDGPPGHSGHGSRGSQTRGHH